MLEQIKAKALELHAKALELQPKAQAFAKQWGPTAILLSPILIAPVFVATVMSGPPTASPQSSITVKLPPAQPYVGKKHTDQTVASQQVVQTETKVVYVDVPAEDGKPATVKPVTVDVPVAIAPPVMVPTLQQSQPELDRIMTEPTLPPPPEKAPPRRVTVTPVQYDRTKTGKFQPDYPDTLRQAGVQGTVHVQVVVGPDGRPRYIRPITGPNAQLMDHVRKYGMKNWRFKPATVGGVPSTGNIDVSITFKLAGN
jgi:TonB family protein